MLNPFSNPAYLLSPLIALAVSFILVIIVVSRGGRTKGKWLFTGVLLSVGIWGLLLYGMRSSPDVEHAVIWNKIGVIPGTATFILFYHFTAVYTRARKQKWIIIGAYILLIITSAMAPTDLIMKAMKVESYGYAPIHGDFKDIVSVCTFLPLACGFYNLISTYRLSNSYEERNRILYLLIAIMFPVVGGALDATTNLPPMLVWGLIIFVLICSFAIVRFHLLDIRIVFRRGMSYLLISTIVAIPYVAVLISLSNVVNLSIDNIWYHILIILGLSIALHPLQQWAQQLVDRFFFRERYDHLLSLARLSRETQSVLDINELCNKLMRSLSGALGITNGCIFLRSDDNNSYVINTCIDDSQDLSDISIKKNSLFIDWFETHGHGVTARDLDIIPQMQSMPAEEKRMIARLDATVFIPILYQGVDLTGILALGHKNGGNRFSAEDRQLILTVVGQMAISIENARLYQSERNMRQTLERVDAQKTEFLHSVAHELKTPLTAILSSSELLDDNDPEADAVMRRLYGNIRRSANIMNRSVTELLELARMQIGDVKIETSPLEIKSVLVDSASQLMVLFENRNQTIVFDLPDEIPPIEADKDKIQQVLFNLLSNANKYSPEGTEIKVRAAVVDDFVKFEVIDAAQTISPEDTERIFTPYFRAEEAKSNPEAPGLGLGLAITKKFIDLHNGNIWVESNPTGGNIFAFTIPVSKSTQ